MTEPDTTGPTGETTTSSLADTENERASAATKLTIGLAGVAVIIVVGLVISIIMAFRSNDEPLVSLDPSTDTGATAQVEGGQFEPDPVFDRFERVVYVPLEPNGVILSETLASSNRPADQAPSGVMLQRIHGNMDLPFSTSDGPTGFTDTGVATGFARTAQGAALAATHYLSYLLSGDNRAEMVAEAGHSSDPALLLEGVRVPDNTGVSAAPMVKVNFNPDLSLVKFGVTVERSNGATEIQVTKIPLAWREGTGWVVQLDSPAFSSEFEPLSSEGWQQWW